MSSLGHKLLHGRAPPCWLVPLCLQDLHAAGASAAMSLRGVWHWLLKAAKYKGHAAGSSSPSLRTCCKQVCEASEVCAHHQPCTA